MKFVKINGIIFTTAGLKTINARWHDNTPCIEVTYKSQSLFDDDNFNLFFKTAQDRDKALAEIHKQL